jgi:hypothetical protein
MTFRSSVMINVATPLTNPWWKHFAKNKLIKIGLG